MASVSTEVFYRKIPASSVDPAKVSVADKARSLAEHKLGLPPVEIQWYIEVPETEYRRGEKVAELERLFRDYFSIVAGRDERAEKNFDGHIDEGGFWGKFRGSQERTILVNENAPLSMVANIVGHELRHLADCRDGLFAGIDAPGSGVRERLEARADEFGAEVEKELRQ